MIRLFAYFLFAVISTLLSSKGFADDCSPDFGENALSWVNNKASKQSRDLAITDYNLRSFSYRLVGYERLQDELNQISDDLDAVSESITNLDNSGREDLALAVEREKVSESNIPKLYKISSVLGKTESQYKRISSSIDEKRFLSDGYPVVGRETLIASIREVGESARKTLVERYSFHVRVKFDEEGNPIGAHEVNTAGGDLTNAGMSVMLASKDGFSAVAGFIMVTAGAIIDSECKKKYETQNEKVDQAAKLLSKKLISFEEQWTLIQEIEQKNLVAFQDYSTKIKGYINKLQKRWRTLFKANAARAAVSEKVLTEAKIEQIRNELELGLNPADIRNQIAVIDVADGVKRLNASVARSQIDMIQSCLDSKGLYTEENLRDLIRFSGEQFKAFRNQAGFAELHQMLDRSEVLLEKARTRLQNQSPSVTRRSCSRKGLSSGMNTDLDFQESSLFEDYKDIFSFDYSPRQVARPTQRVTLNKSANLGFCLMVRNGQVYLCGSQDQGTPYGNEFDNTGDSRRDILLGANDGGLAQDSRQLSRDIEQASLNMDNRIAELSRKSEQVLEGFDSWKTTNSSALNSVVQETSSKLDSDAKAEEDFNSDAEELLTDVQEELDNFLGNVSDPAAIANLIRTVGGADLSLPGISENQVPANSPQIPGISVIETTYGSTTPRAMRYLMQERLRSRDQLNGDINKQDLSNQLLSAVESVNRTTQNNGGVIVDSLLLDAANLRYESQGLLSNPEIAIVNEDGTIVREALADYEDLPENALLNVVRRFQLDQEFYKSASSSLRNSLSFGAPYASRRSEVLGVADSLFARASTSFYDAQRIDEAQAFLSMALGVLDIATNFIPGVDWGRDVYEAVTGKDLFTGEILDDFDRISAVIGVLTAGVGNNGLKVAKVLKKFPDLPTKRKDDIYEFAQTVDSDTLDTLKFTEHARERMSERTINMDDIRNTLDDHTPFWSREHHSYTAVSNTLTGGERIGVAVNVEKQTVSTVMRMDADVRKLRFDSGSMIGQPRYEEIKLD